MVGFEESFFLGLSLVGVVAMVVVWLRWAEKYLNL